MPITTTAVIQKMPLVNFVAEYVNTQNSPCLVPSSGAAVTDATMSNLVARGSGVFASFVVKVNYTTTTPSYYDCFCMPSSQVPLCGGGCCPAETGAINYGYGYTPSTIYSISNYKLLYNQANMHAPCNSNICSGAGVVASPDNVTSPVILGQPYTVPYLNSTAFGANDNEYEQVVAFIVFEI